MADALQNADDLKAAALNALGDSATPPPDGTQGEPAAPPAEPVAPVVDAPPNPAPDTPQASNEPKEGDKDWKVPGERLQDEVKKRKEIEDENTRLKAELEATKTPDEPDDDPAPSPDDEDEVVLEPAVLKAMKKQGFLTRAEAEKLAEEKAAGALSADKAVVARQQQAIQDRQELTKEFADKGYPAFDVTAILPRAIEMVGENNLSREVLRAAYLEQHAKEIENVLIKQANATKSAPAAIAERPGGNPVVNGAADTSKSVKDSTKDRISAAIPD